MTQTPSSLKSKVEIVLDVTCLNFAPRIAIMLPIHSLHLAKLIVEINKGEFKQNITIRCGWNVMNIFNVKFIIVQLFQFRTNMRSKSHCLEIVYYIQHKWFFHIGNVFNGIKGIIRNESIMTHVQQ
jgi:hypothetical protein